MECQSESIKLNGIRELSVVSGGNELPVQPSKLLQIIGKVTCRFNRGLKVTNFGGFACFLNQDGTKRLNLNITEVVSGNN